MNAAGNVRSSVVILGEHDLTQASACAADSDDGDGDPHAHRHYECAPADKIADNRSLHRAFGLAVMRPKWMSGLGAIAVRKRCQLIARAAATGGSAHEDAFADKIVDVARCCVLR